MSPRERGTAIIIYNDKLLLMHRNNHGKEYYAFIGGGVEDSEAPEDATAREVQEETSLNVTISKHLYTVIRTNGDIHYVYLCNYLGGVPKLHKKSAEYKRNIIGVNTYAPKWLPISQMKNTTIYPDIIKFHLINDLEKGFKQETKIIETD